MRTTIAPGYTFGIIVLCAGYVLFQLLCIPSIWLEVDELWFAHHIYQYTQQLPYADFLPYKTVLGYYLLSLPLYIVHGVLTPVYFIKDEIAVINTGCLAIVALFAARMFNPRAVFYTLTLIVCNQLFLLFSTELRVDMLTSWLCLFSILLLVNERNAWAGLLLGLAFLTSQKALWYIAGTNLALGVCWLVDRDTGKNFRALVKFNVTLVAVVLVYLSFWAYFSSWHEVLRSVFYEGYTQAKINYYANASNLYWEYLLQHGPVLIMLLPLTVLTLLEQALTKQRILLMVYGFFSLVIIGTYKQFFSYNMVFLLPALFVVYAECISWVLQPTPKKLDLSQRGLFWFFSLYLVGMVALMIHLGLALGYYVVFLVPIIIWHSVAKNIRLSKISLALMGAVLLLTGMFIPLMNFGATMHVIEANYQRSSILLADDLLKHDDYIAGTYLFYNRNQSLPGFENLIQPALDYAHHADGKLLPILIPSLNITPKTASQMIADLQAAPVKLLLNSVRIAALPASVLGYLRTEYQHYWGAIYLYAPTVQAGQSQFSLKFSDTYQLEAAGNIMVDNHSIAPGTVLSLAAGMHSSKSAQQYRLRLLPQGLAGVLSLRRMHDCPNCLFKKPLF